MRKLLLVVIMFVFVGQAMAQVGYTKQQVIQRQGTEYEIGWDDDGELILHYVHYTHNGHKYLTYYFFNKDNMCIASGIADSIGKANDYIKLFDKKFVLIDKLKWKDYETGLIYKMKLNDQVCTIIIYL